MLCRRLNVDEKHVIAVGDSAGDIGMFEEAAHAICFNPWDERPLPMQTKLFAKRILHWFYNLAAGFSQRSST